MKRQTAVRQSSLYSAPLFIALFSILLPGRLVALDLGLVRVGGYVSRRGGLRRGGVGQLEQHQRDAARYQLGNRVRQP